MTSQSHDRRTIFSTSSSRTIVTDWGRLCTFAAQMFKADMRNYVAEIEGLPAD